MKVTVNSVVPKVSAKGKAYQQVIYNGNLSASAFDDDFTSLAGKECDVEITVKGQFTNIKLLKEGVHQETKKESCACDDSVSIRKSAGLLAIEKLKASGQTIVSDAFWVAVKEFEAYLTDGTIPGQVKV
jgi:hypothetical protein